MEQILLRPVTIVSLPRLSDMHEKWTPKMIEQLNYLFTKNFRRAVERKTTLLLLNSSALALAACGSGSSGTTNVIVDDSVNINSLNRVQGSNEDESLLGTSAADYVEGMDGADFILSLEGEDEIYGGSGDDTIWAGDGHDIIYGGTGNDTIYPGNGNDKSYGGDGDDIIFLSSGNDLEDGGDGNDTLKIDSNHSGIATTIDLLLGQYYFTAQGSSAFFNLNSIENLESQSTADLTVLDTPAVNVITTGAGNDLVKSIGGNDIVNTGGGNDRVELASGFKYSVNTGSGDDEIVLGLTYSSLDGGSGTDTLIVKALSGVSTFHADISQGFYFFQGLATSQDGFDALLSNIEKIHVEGQLNAVLIGGNSSDTFTTGSGSDNLSSGSGNDVIDAGAGDDILNGGAGSDTLTGGAGADMFVFSATNGTDTIVEFVSGTDLLNVDALVADVAGAAFVTYDAAATTSVATGSVVNNATAAAVADAAAAAALFAADDDDDAATAAGMELDDGASIILVVQDDDGAAGVDYDAQVFRVTSNADGSVITAELVATLDNAADSSVLTFADFV